MLKRLFRPLIAFVWKRLSKSRRLNLIRRLAKVPDDAYDPEFIVKIAETREELEASYRLLYQSYVDQGLMTPDASGMRLNVYAVLPETMTVIVMKDQEVVGTVSLVKDGTLGLPSDKDYAKENQSLRSDGYRLIEVSALAIRKDYRSTQHSISLLLMKFLYHQAHYMDGNCLVCTLHPRAQDFYEAIWGFDRLGGVVDYEFVNGAQAIHMNLPLSDVKKDFLVASYASKELRKNLALWVLYENDPRFHYPLYQVGQVLDPVFTPEYLRYFAVEKTKMFAGLSTSTRLTVLEIYSHFFKPEDLKSFFLRGDRGVALRSFRLPLNLSVSLNFQNEFHITKIHNLSSRGAFVALESVSHLPMQEPVDLHFKIGREFFHVRGKVIWINREIRGYLPVGVGLQFDQFHPRIDTEIRKFSYRKKSA